MKGFAGAWAEGRFWIGPALTVAAILLGHFLWRALFADATLIPGAAFVPVFLTTVLATFLGKRSSGLVSATIATSYVAYLVTFAPEFANLAKWGLITATLFAAVLLVGRLKEQADASLEHQRSIAQQERRNAAEANQAVEVLRANNETLETFVYVITHDLKEPVRAVDHHVKQAQLHAGSKDAEADVAEALETNRRLGVLLQRLLEYSRASLTLPTIQSLTLHDVLDDAVCRPIYEHTLRIRKARLETPPDAAHFLADPTLLGQAMGNIILNAVKHNPSEDPCVKISLGHGPRGNVVDIIVRDNGPGFPPALLHRFRSLKANRPATLSGGFGLVIARRAIERLGGTMAIANVDGSGEVRLSLPRAPSSSDRAELGVRSGAVESVRVPVHVMDPLRPG